MTSRSSQQPSLRLTWAAGFKQGLASEFLLFRHPAVILAVMAIIVVPSLYALIYVSSVWDPYGNLSQLPAALVNVDTAVLRDSQKIVLGDQIVAKLEEQHPFRFKSYPSAKEAQTAVREGAAFFAVIIPPDFTQRALAAREADPAEFQIYTSEGGNYTASLLSKRFGLELAHTLNESINRERWTALTGTNVSGASPTLATALAALDDGGRRLAVGSSELQEGAAKLVEGAEHASVGALKLSDGTGKLTPAGQQLSHGMKQVEDAVATIKTQLPVDHQMEELSIGSHALRDGAAQLAAGFGQLESGAVRLRDGALQLETGARRVPLVGGKLGDGAAQLKQGLITFKAGLDRVAEGANQLDAGSNRLDTGIQPLTAGIIRLNAGLETLQSSLPPPDQLDLFGDSMLQLQSGSQQLATGMDQLLTGANRLSSGSAEIARGAREISEGLSRLHSRFEGEFGGAHSDKLAASVAMKVEIAAPVQNNGAAFAPYFSSLSLWIGAVMMSFVFHLRRLVAPLRLAPRSARWLSKAAMLYGMGLLQASVLFLVISCVLRIPLVHPLQVWLAALLGSFAFVSVVFFFLSVLGDAGRLLAVILLIFQLAASGGIYPVELSHSFYQRAHGYLPFSLLVRAFRATMFSAFDGHWNDPAVKLVGVAAGAIALGIALARWKYMPPENYAAAVDF